MDKRGIFLEIMNKFLNVQIQNTKLCKCNHATNIFLLCCKCSDIYCGICKINLNYSILENIRNVNINSLSEIINVKKMISYSQGYFNSKNSKNSKMTTELKSKLKEELNFKNNLNLSKEELLENKISKDDIGSIANDLNQQKVTQIETPTEILVNPKSENSNSNSIEISKNYRSDEFTKSEGFNIHEILKDKLNDQNKFEFTIYKFTSYFVNPTIKLLEENQDLNIRPEISLKLKNLNLLTHSFVEINSQSTLNIQLVLCSKCFKFAFYESFSQNFLNIINDNNYFEFSLLNKLLTNTILKYLTSFKQRS